MPYRELQFTVGAEIAEPLGDALIEIGALSVSVEDAAVCEMMQKAMADGQSGESFIEMGGKTLESGGTSKLSERAIRNFWHNYRSDMDLA